MSTTRPLRIRSTSSTNTNNNEYNLLFFASDRTYAVAKSSKCTNTCGGGLVQVKFTEGIFTGAIVFTGTKEQCERRERKMKEAVTDNSEQSAEEDFDDDIIDESYEPIHNKSNDKNRVASSDDEDETESKVLYISFFSLLKLIQVF
jgi:hypothetical protein